MLSRTCTLVSIALVLSLFAVNRAAATAQRTFVASRGNDGNPCSIAAPCRGFAAAVAQTNSGGEVIVLDSAGYGTVTIAKSVSIIAPPGVYAGVTVPTGATGIAVDGPGINVVLRGLSINGSDVNGVGIRMISGSSLAVDNCTISNVGFGVSVDTAASVNIAGVAIKNSFAGITVGFGAVATITNTQIANSTFSAIHTSGLPADGTTTNIFVTDTVIAGGGYCLLNLPAVDANANISATRVTVTGCGTAIANEPFPAGSTTVSNSMVTGNSYGFYNLAGTFNTLGTNLVSGNTNDTFGTITTIGGK